MQMLLGDYYHEQEYILGKEWLKEQQQGPRSSGVQRIYDLPKTKKREGEGLPLRDM